MPEVTNNKQHNQILSLGNLKRACGDQETINNTCMQRNVIWA